MSGRDNHNPEEAARTRSGRRFRPAIALLTALAGVAVASGIGFAASSALEGTQVAVQRVAGEGARSIAVRNAAAEAYKDPGVVVTRVGPPEVLVTNQRRDADGDPIPLRAATRPGDPDVVLSASLSVNESGTLSIQVLRSDGTPARIDCSRTQVQTGSAGVASEAAICRVVINSPGTVKVTIYVPAKNITAGEDLNIRLGYTDKDAGRKRTVVDVPAAAPAALPKLTRTFRLTDEDLANIRSAVADGGIFGVTFRAYVRGETPTVSITWAGKTVKGLRTGMAVYDKQAQVDRAAVVTVAGGEIAGGDFAVTDYDCSGSASDPFRPNSLLSASSVTLTLRNCAGVTKIVLAREDLSRLVNYVPSRRVGSGTETLKASFIIRAADTKFKLILIGADNQIIGIIPAEIPRR